MNIIAWIILGALAGWFASILAGTNAQMGALANIAVGILGAFLGGFLVQAFGGAGITGFNLWSLIVATLGAIVLLMIVKVFTRSHHSV
jgi:uncharacterized membrane protein YeaQ/YmgE (transglycosylase-associated protein family)